jgi:hypothetical protein
MKTNIIDLIIISALLLFLYNGFTWLRSGVWLPVESLFLLKVPALTEWYNAPTNWFGLHHLAKMILPLPWGSALLLAIGVIYHNQPTS